MQRKTFGLLMPALQMILERETCNGILGKYHITESVRDRLFCHSKQIVKDRESLNLGNESRQIVKDIESHLGNEELLSCFIQPW